MAVVIPVLLMLVLGPVEFGVAVWRYNTVSNAAREGARAGVVDGCSAAAVQTGVQRLMVGLVPGPSVESPMTPAGYAP
jgi:Flp pilus assembly protein TadG